MIAVRYCLWELDKHIEKGYNYTMRIPSKINPKTLTILKDIKKAGGKPYIIGGWVRDLIMGINSKDVDVECFNITAKKLEFVLRKHTSNVDAVGMAFGIFKVDMRKEGGDELDFSLPRTENKEGQGHKGFIVEIDPTITLKEAASRRDITCNSMFYDPFLQEVIDFYGGIEDIHNKIIRHTSKAFMEDPLRVLRIMRFAARFSFVVATETINLSKFMITEFDSLAKERILIEFNKMLQKGKYISLGLDVLVQTGWISKFPVLDALRSTPQEPAHHPEGNAWDHTLHTIDAARVITDKLNVLYAALLHDVGKPATTEVKDGKIISHAHDIMGEEPARQFLDSIGMKETYLIERIIPLVREHMAHVHNRNPSKRAVRRLARRLHPCTITELLMIMEADHDGRPPLKGGLPKEAIQIREIAKDLQVESQAPKEILLGRHLIERGMNPSPKFGDILRDAFEAQLDGVFNNLEEGQVWLDKYITDVL